MGYHYTCKAKVRKKVALLQEKSDKATVNSLLLFHAVHAVDPIQTFDALYKTAQMCNVVYI